MPSLTARPPVVEGVKDYGHIIEYIQNRVYLASYAHPPGPETPFPYSSITTKTPSKRPSKSQNAPAQPVPVVTGPKKHPPAYFTVDDELLYNRFHADFGPFHIGHLYRFAVHLHEFLGDPDNEDRGVVFWSRPDARSRANAACLLACYMIVIQSWPPHLALAPLTQQDQPVMPFRDAGYSQADYEINVQDVVYGVFKAKEEGLCGFQKFNLNEYERYERVDQGDFNWITPNFVALASPQHAPIEVIPTSSPLWAALPKTIEEVKKSNLPKPFRNVLAHFKDPTRETNVGLIVRLNSELYSPSYFEALGIRHLDMIFADGTCPSMENVRKFIRLAHEMITIKKKAIAVHCKAGLGRTGCLIGAYLIYRHGFTANEVIAFMRFMRPGMVVGPQQHWLHLHQGKFREWWWEEYYMQKFQASVPLTPTKALRHPPGTISNGQTATPPNGSSHGKRSALGELNHNETAQASYAVDDNLPAPTPGQPRKASHARHHPYSRAASAAYGIENAPEQPGNEVVEMKSHRRSQDEAGVDNEEWIVSRRTNSRSPESNDKRRAVSYTHTTTTTLYDIPGDEPTPPIEDLENWISAPPPYADEVKPSRPKTPGSVKSGSGSGTLGILKSRAAPLRRSAESREVKSAGVRKTSARVGSANFPAAASRSRS
ncbi:MAG: hypothetical protein L6R40_002439 [Gallowayella cf. fulva]|nr:MAG: hypothetical protein L6R40_002439 [Xanthomendoza cf. fulva]